MVARVLMVASATFVVAGWAVGTIARDHIDTCGQPANLPSGSAFPLAALGVLTAIAALVMGLVRASEGRERPGMGTALIAVPITVGILGVVELVWVTVSHMQICF